MTRIYLIRHAEAEGNLCRRAQGHFNANITQLGRAQLAALAERFRSVRLDALWSSDLNRAVSTANAVRKYHRELELHTTPRLREIDVGVWEDVPWGNLAAEYPEQMELFTHDPARWSVPGGEPYAHVIERMVGTITELAKEYDGKTIAVVSHGVAIRALLCELLGVPSAEIARVPHGDNTAVTLLTAEDGRLALAWYNDNSHLGDLSTSERQGWWRQSQEPASKRFAVLSPYDLKTGRALYMKCYENTWRASHGNLNGYVPSIYLTSAEKHAREDPRCVTEIRLGGAFAGLIELDPERGREDGFGWISLLYVEPDFRGRRLGIQLIGHAVSYFRRQGRHGLRLHVSQTNENALGFYERSGFTRVKKASGVGGSLYLMEADITQRVLTPREIGRKKIFLKK